MKITLPDINAQALEKRGQIYILKDDIVDWLDECAKTFDRYDIPPQVREVVKGIADCLSRTRTK